MVQEMIRAETARDVELFLASRRTPPRGRIPLAVPTLQGREWEYVKDCLDSGWVSSVGPSVDAFERAMAAYVGVEHAIGVSSGTAALHLAMIGAGVEPGSEVVVPSLTFIGTINPIRYCGAFPVYVDVDPYTLTVSPGALAELLAGRYRRDAVSGLWLSRSTGRPLAAVAVVDLYGHPADFDAIDAAVAPYGVPIVEDAAEALGATYKGRQAGRLGTIGALSFNGNKVITTGGGGMVLTNDHALAGRLRHLSTQARDDRREYSHDLVGFNYRLTNLQSALGLAQLEQLDSFVAAKRDHAARYREAFGQLGGVRMIVQQPWATSSYWLISVVVDSVTGSREHLHRLIDGAAEDGIEIRPFFTPAHLQAPYAEPGHGPLDVTERLFAGGVNLPSSVVLADDEIDYVVSTLSRLADLTPRAGW